MDIYVSRGAAERNKQLAIDKKNRRKALQLVEQEMKSAPPQNRQADREKEQDQLMGGVTPPYQAGFPIPSAQPKRKKQKGEMTLYEELLEQRKPLYAVINDFKQKLNEAVECHSKWVKAKNAPKNPEWQGWEVQLEEKKVKDLKLALVTSVLLVDEKMKRAIEADQALIKLSPWPNKDGRTYHTYVPHQFGWETNIASVKEGI